MSKFENVTTDFKCVDESLNHFMLHYECDYGRDLRRDIEARRKEFLSKHKISANGFRRGKEPLTLVVHQVGKDYFFINILLEALECLNGDESSLIERIVFIKDVNYNGGNRFGFDVIVSRFKDVPVIESDYKGIKMEKQSDEVTDEEYDKEVNRIVMSKRSFEEKKAPAEDGDYVLFEYEINVDDREIKEESNIVMDGKDSRWNDEFKNAIIGHSDGDEFNAIIKFEEDHPHHLFHGKELDFKIKIKTVNRIVVPEVNNRFALQYGCADLEAFKEKVRDNVKQSKINANDDYYNTQVENFLLDKYSEADFGISEEFIEMEIEKKLHGYKKMYGRGFDDFEKDKKEEYIKFVEEIKAHVIKGIKIDVILQCISNKEGIKVGEEDLLQARNDYPYLQQAPNAEGMISFLRRKKAMEKLVECAVME